MRKKKNYQAPRAQPKEVTGSASPIQPKIPGHAYRNPDIDMVALLGPDARFTNSIRNIVLRDQFGRGIDDWVWATSAAIESELLAGTSPSSAAGHRHSMLTFYDFLTQGAIKGPDGVRLLSSKPATPSDFKPIHVEQFVAFIKKRDAANGYAKATTRHNYQAVKATLLVMFNLALIPGESHRFFRRGVFGRNPESSTTSISEAEQERLASAIKDDLSAIHHGRLRVSMRELQALRLLVIAHRMGHNRTPLLELERDSMRPGLLPGTIQIQTIKQRSKKIVSQMGSEGASTPMVVEYLPFSLAEGAVIGQAIASTEYLVHLAPQPLRNRVWLYQVSKTGFKTKKGTVSALSAGTLFWSIKALVVRHALLGDDGNPLVVNNSRLRKSRFDRAFRLSDGDLMTTANLMGNTPAVAGVNYPSMNTARQAEAANFMNDEYIDMMRNTSALAKNHAQDDKPLRVVAIEPVHEVGTSTPVAGCSDALWGEHAPKNGNPCDRFVMCLFCSSFAIVGAVDELWKLFSFQSFARMELAYLESRLGPNPEIEETIDGLLDLRDRYRLAIPYIDSFTSKQFAASRVLRARQMTANALHPFWFAQVQSSRRARLEDPVLSDKPAASAKGTDEGGDLLAYNNKWSEGYGA